MTGLEFVGVVGVVLLIQFVMFLVFAVVMFVAVRKISKALMRNTKKILAAMNEEAEDSDDRDYISRDVWDQATKRAANDPQVANLLRDAGQQRGNPRNRFVEPGQLDL